MLLELTSGLRSGINMTANKIPFNHVVIAAQKKRKQILKVIDNVIDSGQFLTGKQSQKLENKLQKYFGSGYVVTTASGHDSLLLALSALKLKSTDEIIFPVNAYPTAFPIFLSGCKPIPVDVDANGQMDINDLSRKITANTRAIIFVHLYGLVGNIDKALKIAKDKKIILIEDCAQVFGSKFKDKPIGTFGAISCFSFYPTKNLGSLGEGGAIWTNNKIYYDYFIKAKAYGETRRYWSEFISGHSRITEIQAAIINIYLNDIKKDIKKRKNLAKYYFDKLSSVKLRKYIRLLKSHPDADSVVHLFVIEAQNRDSLVKYLKKKNIETHIHYPYPIHLLPAFASIKAQVGMFPMAERLSKNIISLPFHGYLTKKDIDYVVKSIESFYERN